MYEELDNILSTEEKELSVVSRAIDNYRYTAIHKGHNEYKIIDRERIGRKFPVEPIIAEVLSEVIGPDWEDYDE